MKKKVILSLFLFSCVFFSPLHAKNYRYNLSVCAIFNDEADYLKEWIEYHLLMGVEHFYLYNNNSIDDYMEVLLPYIEEGIVDLTDWPSPPGRNWTPWQREAYGHCLKIAKKQTKWLAIIDLDEYVLPLSHGSIPEFLKGYEKFGGVKIYWQNYGTSHLPSIPDGKLMTESLTLKYPTKSEVNSPGKTIFRPKAVKKARIHNMVYRKGYYAVTEDKEPYTDQPVTVGKIRINHYWTRAEDFFYQVKIPRIETYSNMVLPQETIDKILYESNQVEDKMIYPHIVPLRIRMGLN